MRVVASPVLLSPRNVAQWQLHRLWLSKLGLQFGNALSQLSVLLLEFLPICLGGFNFLAQILDEFAEFLEFLAPKCTPQKTTSRNCGQPRLAMRHIGGP